MRISDSLHAIARTIPRSFGNRNLRRLLKQHATRVAELETRAINLRTKQRLGQPSVEEAKLLDETLETLQ